MKGIAKFYKRQAFDMLMFATVKALQRQLPLTIDYCLEEFKIIYNVGEEYPLESLRTTYHRLQHEFHEAERTP